MAARVVHVVAMAGDKILMSDCSLMMFTVRSFLASAEM